MSRSAKASEQNQTVPEQSKPSPSPSRAAVEAAVGARHCPVPPLLWRWLWAPRGPPGWGAAHGSAGRVTRDRAVWRPPRTPARHCHQQSGPGEGQAVGVRGCSPTAEDARGWQGRWVRVGSPVVPSPPCTGPAKCFRRAPLLHLPQTARGAGARGHLRSSSCPPPAHHQAQAPSPWGVSSSQAGPPSSDLPEAPRGGAGAVAEGAGSAGGVITTCFELRVTEL